MLHGLGHLTNPFPNSVEGWHGDIWLDILKLHYYQITETDIEEEFSGLFVISQLTITTPTVLNRFKKLNEGKPWKEQIKPFNFVLVGFQIIEEDGKSVKPMLRLQRTIRK